MGINLHGSSLLIRCVGHCRGGTQSETRREHGFDGLADTRTAHMLLWGNGRSRGKLWCWLDPVGTADRIRRGSSFSIGVCADGGSWLKN